MNNLHSLDAAHDLLRQMQHFQECEETAIPQTSDFCFSCQHWPEAGTGHPNRYEMCQKGHGQTHGFAVCFSYEPIEVK